MFIRYANIDIIQLIIQMSLSNNQTMYRSHFKNEYSVYSIKTIKRILKMKYSSNQITVGFVLTMLVSHTTAHDCDISTAFELGMVDQKELDEVNCDRTYKIGKNSTLAFAI